MIICYTVLEIWHVTNVLVVFHFGHFLPFYPPNSPKNKNFKKCLEISSFYIRVPKIMIICYTVPEIWHVMNVNVIFHFGLLFTLLPPPPHPALTAWKMKNSKKGRKYLEISSFYTSAPKTMIICTKSHDYMLYYSWDMAHDRCNCCFSFWANFYPFTPLTAWKLRISKKWRKKMPEDIIVLHNCTKNYDYWLYCSWDMVRDGCNCYFSFWAIFYPFTP